MRGILSTSLSVALIYITSVSANFHIMNRVFIGAGPYPGPDGPKVPGGHYYKNDAIYVPSNEYNCANVDIGGRIIWKGGDSGIPQPTADTFTAYNPICGVQNMRFIRRDSGGFDLEDSNGPAGECFPNQGSQLNCDKWGGFVYRETAYEEYWCDTYACKGGTDQ